MLRRLTAWCVLSAFVATLPGAPAFAELVGEQVVKGRATFERNGKHTKITTHTRQTIVDYRGFDIERDETVRIDQPNARSRILNRVNMGDASRIEGGLSSNGIVYILNPAGVFIGDRAVIDVSGLVAGAASMSNRDFLKRVDRFTDVKGDVSVAEGAEIRAAGNVALIGRHVQNLGAIESRKGTIALVAGEDVVLAPLDGNILVRVDGGPPEADAASPARFGVEQGGELSAQRVVLAAGDHYSLAMNHTGVTHAVREIRAQAGEDGLAQVAGTLDVSNEAAGKQGGRIELRAGKIALLQATLDASGAAGGGEILVGGDVRGSGAGTKARRVAVSADAKLSADALDAGDGGKIVIYADERTAFYGELSARGGEQGGDGGFAEISGRQLTSRGKADLGAPQGEAGTLLYDPEKIVIRGGTSDGTDAPAAPATPDSVVGDGGTLGQVLAGDDGVGGEPFEIFESEIEGTDANIILEATNRIETAESFGGDEVTLKSGRSLTLRTTGNTAGGLPDEELGIDLTAGGNETLAWRVSDGANITMQTSLDTNLANDGAKASITVGRLISEGAAYKAQVDGASAVEQVDAIRSISLTAERGDVTVRGTVAIDGDDARPEMDGAPARIASSGGDVVIQSQQGDVTLGDDSSDTDLAISAKGGGATETDYSLGARGGRVDIATLEGAVNVHGDIDVSGGTGIGAPTIDGRPVPVPRADAPTTRVTQGGSGGSISLDASGENGAVTVTADLKANGGEGRALDDSDLSDDVFDALGGAMGTIGIGADKGIDIGDAAEGGRVLLQANGGQGSASGGGGIPNAQVSPIQVIGARVANEEGAPLSVVRVDADLETLGGAGGQSIGVGGAESEIGGAGGRGGDLRLAANTGVFDGNGMTVKASGGDGALQLDPLSGRPITAGGLALVASGAGGTVTVDARGDIAVGDITSKGGNATNASAGDDSGGTDGGIVSISTETGDVTVANIDVSGGDAGVDGVAFEDVGVALNGGDAGSVDIVPNSSDPEQPASNGVGDITVNGLVGGAGGSGRAADGTTVTHGSGAVVDALASRTDGVIRTGAAGRFQGGLVQLEGAIIGSADARVEVAGTPGTDTAVFTVWDELHGEYSQEADEKLEQLRVVMREDEAEAHLHTAGGTEVLRSSGVSGTHTLEVMQTDDDAPRLSYRLFVLPDPDQDDDPMTTDPEPQPDLLVERGAVSLGAAGGEIANDSTSTPTQPATNRGRILGEAAGTGAHVTSEGDVLIEGLSVGSETTPLQLAGVDGAGAVTFDVAGSIDAALDGGDAHFGAIEIRQRNAIEGDARIDDLEVAGANEIEIEGGGASGSANVSRIVRADTTGDGPENGSNFVYRLLAPNSAVLEVDEVVLGGAGLLQSSGHLVLTDADPVAVTANGNRLTLITAVGGDIVQEGGGVELEMGGDGAGDPAALVFVADAFGTSAEAPIRSTGLEQIAGTATDGDIYLENTGSDLTIQRVVNPAPADVNAGGDPADTQNNLGAIDGDVSVVNKGGDIVFGRLIDGAELQQEHVRASGDITLAVDAGHGFEIDNARVIKTVVPGVGEVFTTHNDARVTSTGGDIDLGGPIDTRADAIPESDDPDAPTFVDPVHAKLMLDAAKGTTTLRGDVGNRGDDDAGLALLDVTGNLVLAAHPEDASSTAADRTLVLADARFRGKIDGAGKLTIDARDLPHQENAADVASVSFEGDIGTGIALKGLVVDAEKIQFTSADRVVTGDDGVDLSTNQTGIPTAATISDTGGGLRIQTTGDFSVGDLVDGGDGIHVDKLTSAGPLAIKADAVRIADVNATQLSIEANEITVYARAPGFVTRPDGTTPSDPADMDTGTDIVADSMRFSVVPEIDPLSPGAPPRLGLGSGGIRAPGSMRAFDVVRFTSDESSVDAGDMIGAGGQVLDLTPSGGTIVGDPIRDLPRFRPTPDPTLQAQPGDDAPAPAPALTAEQVIAYLHCGSSTGPSEACAPDDHAPLAAVGDWQASAFATPRAGELAADYREMRQKDLSRAFDAAAAGFRAAQGFGEFDGEAFARYVETSPDAAEARAAVHDFAELLVGVELLGLSPEQAGRARRELAAELAAEAELPGFDADAVLEAVDATPIRMPPAE